MRKPVIKIDENIPFIKGRLEEEADVEYLDQNAFTPQSVKDADGIIVRTRTRCGEALLKDSAVSFVATATIGTDHIDLPYCEGKGIEVCNSPGCNAPGVAQYVWSSLLNLGFRPGIDRLGVIGYGNVGGIVADWGERLNTEVLVSDPPKSRDAKREGRKLFEDAESSLVREASLEEILKECDAITLHTPLTKDGDYPTFHMIGHREVSLMKPGAILINAARGPVTDSEALKKALKSGKIRAVIDTWENEPELDTELLELVTIATPHIAGYSRQGKERATRMVIEAANRYFGINGDFTGLTGAYLRPKNLSATSILSSYNP
ncbi:MAG: 4-phosphoerythronate dehydrogenase, partial [Muribaculaceae bacterium]|nr:4-phosphoerythronate dehydrogenase [Muribaculaceae bacterium]